MDANVVEDALNIYTNIYRINILNDKNGLIICKYTK